MRTLFLSTTFLSCLVCGNDAFQNIHVNSRRAREKLQISRSRQLTSIAISLQEYEDHSQSGHHHQRGRRNRGYQLDTDFSPQRPGLNKLFVDHGHGTDWGIEQREPPEPKFPDSVDAIAEAAFEAIAATLYGQAKLDPSFASNAMAQSVLDYRAVKRSTDSGRIGIEIDGAEHLMEDSGGTHGSAVASRQVVLQLALKLTRGIWEAYEEPRKTKSGKPCNKHPKPRPVVIFFNSMNQALLASQELRLLQGQLSNGKENVNEDDNSISILVLGDDLPDKVRHQEIKRYTRHNKYSSVDPKRGLVIVVQPTDFNSEYKPPGPAIGSVTHFQKLILQAGLANLATVTVSPRFLANDPPFGNGWEQNGGCQQSATYGGMEPPPGPTPWVLRDFNPPVYCWIGNALQLSARRYPRPGTTSHFYSRIALVQSVMDEQHPWHIFAVQTSTDSSSSSTSKFEYLASTKASAGRPTRELIRHVFTEFNRMQPID